MPLPHSTTDLGIGRRIVIGRGWPKTQEATDRQVDLAHIEYRPGSSQCKVSCSSNEFGVFDAMDHRPRERGGIAYWNKQAGFSVFDGI